MTDFQSRYFVPGEFVLWNIVVPVMNEIHRNRLLFTMTRVILKVRITCQVVYYEIVLLFMIVLEYIITSN